MKVSLGKPGRCFHSLLIAGLALALGAAAPAVAADVAEYRLWLGANGQYLLLDDFAPSARATIVAHASLNRVSGGNMTVFCCRYGDLIKNTFTLFYIPGTGFRFDYGNATKFSGPAANAAESFTIVASGTNYIVNGVSKATGAFADFIPGGGVCHLALFASNLNGDTSGLGNYADIKLFSFKVYDTVGGVDGVLARDLHPCVDTDGKYGLYDTVSGRIYYSGAGSFTISPVEVDVNGNPVGDASPFDYPAGGAFVWDNATGSPADWTNAMNWTAKDGYPGIGVPGVSGATATFGPTTPTAIVSLGGESITNKMLYVADSDLTLANGRLQAYVSLSPPSPGAVTKLSVASSATFDTLGANNNYYSGWNPLRDNIGVIVYGVLTNYSANALNECRGTNVTFLVDGGRMYGANAPMFSGTNSYLRVVNGGYARLGGRWVHQSSWSWHPVNCGYAALGGSTLLHAGGYGVPLTIGEGNYLVVSNSTFGTSQSSMQLTLGAKGNFADFHNAQIGVDGANLSILFNLTGVGNRLGFSGTMQAMAEYNQLSATGTGGTVTLDQDYGQFYAVSLSGTNNTIRVGEAATLRITGAMTISGIASNGLFEVCGVCTNVGQGSSAIRNGTRLFVNGGTFVNNSGRCGFAVTNGGCIAVSGAAPYFKSIGNLSFRDGGALEFRLHRDPWQTAPVECTVTTAFNAGSKVRILRGDYLGEHWVDIPLFKFSPANGGQKLTFDDFENLLELGRGLHEDSYLHYDSDKVLYLHTKYHKDGLTLIVR